MTPFLVFFRLHSRVHASSFKPNKTLQEHTHIRIRVSRSCTAQCCLLASIFFLSLYFVFAHIFLQKCERDKIRVNKIKFIRLWPNIAKCIYEKLLCLRLWTEYQCHIRMNFQTLTPISLNGMEKIKTKHW